MDDPGLGLQDSCIHHIFLRPQEQKFVVEFLESPINRGEDVARSGGLETGRVPDSIDMDLVLSPPLVVAGNFHHQSFDDETFNFEFSDVFDHALYPDKYSANDLFSVDPI
ncbi:hypothetical protein ACS0TY_030155 [Phlomoides rotata]